MKVPRIILASAAALALAAGGTAAAGAATSAPASPTPNVHAFGGLHLSSVQLPRTHLPHPVLRNGTFISNNWAGYAVTARGGKTIPQVNDTFTIPSVNCGASDIGTGGAYVADWAGLDGLVDGTVEQEGIDVYCASTASAPAYVAWYEMFPSPPVTFTGAVSPGDAISVETQRVGSNYVLSLTDVTTDAGFTTTQACPTGSVCKDNSAEVITEDPGGAVTEGIDLPDFGLDNQTGVRAHTYTGLSGGFQSCTFWAAQTVQMEDPSSSLMAVLSSLEGGQAFNVTYRAGD